MAADFHCFSKPVFAQALGSGSSQLTTKQSRQIVEIQERSNQQFLQDFNRLKQLQDEMNLLITSETASENEILQKYQEIKALSQQIMDKDLETRLAIRKILPPQLRRPFAQQLQENVRKASTEALKKP